MKKLFAFVIVALLIAPASFAQDREAPVAGITIINPPATETPAPATPAVEVPIAQAPAAAPVPAPQTAPVAEPAPSLVQDIAGSITPSKSTKYSFDPAHTQVLFKVGHLGFSNSHGRFDKFDGFFTFDAATPEASQVEVTIDARSVDMMGSAKWSEHVRSERFLNAEKFPEMTFKSTKVEKTGERTGKVTGDLTMLGVTKPVTLDVIFNNSGTHPHSGNHIAGFSATGMLKRSEWGMMGSLPAVGDDVSLIIEVEGNRRDFDDIQKK